MTDLHINTSGKNLLSRLKRKDELIGKPISSLIADQAFNSLLQNFLSHQSPASEFDFHKSELSGNIVFWSFLPSYNENNYLTGLLLIGRVQSKNDTWNLSLFSDTNASVQKKVIQFSERITGKSFDNQVTPLDYICHIYRYMDEIISKIPASVYWMDRNGVYLGCNDSMVKLFRWKSRDYIVGKSYNDLYDKKSAEAYRKVDIKVMETGEPSVVEEPLYYEDGSKRTYLSSKVALRDTGTNIIGILGVSVDITEQKRLEEELLERKAQEERRLKALSSMGGMIAHELRTPLTGISFGMHTVEKRVSQLVEVYQEWTTKLNESPIKQRNIDQLRSVCKDMQLSLKQIDNTIDTVLAGFRPSQVSEERMQSISVDKLFNDLLEQYPLSENELKHVSVEYNPELTVRGIEHVLLHVLSNLIKNAFYFIQEMGKGKITLWATQDKDHVSIYIKDTAKGIDNDQLNKIFEPFFTTKDAAASIGMGLYFCKLAIEALNGEIYCESVKGEKTVFTLMLPIGDNIEHE